jgi:hypothetical protein
MKPLFFSIILLQYRYDIVMKNTLANKNRNSAKECELRRELCFAKAKWGISDTELLRTLESLLRTHRLSVSSGDVIWLGTSWFVTQAGLLRIATRRRCAGVHVAPVTKLCDPARARYTFRATVFKSVHCRGFAGYGDADPSNTSPLVHGAEMRVAETRAVNRALRKAYGIGICSVEEIGSTGSLANQEESKPKARKLPSDSASGNHNNGYGGNGNAKGVRVRDRLCQVIRHHGLDAELVKAYAIDFCDTKALREASREQVENFVAHLADWAAKDRNALLCQLNSYSRQQAGAA